MSEAGVEGAAKVLPGANRELAAGGDVLKGLQALADAGVAGAAKVLRGVSRELAAGGDPGNLQNVAALLEVAEAHAPAVAVARKVKGCATAVDVVSCGGAARHGA